jgi:hypothetical protein
VTPEDYQTTAYAWAGPGRQALVDSVQHALHFNESLHMHQDIGETSCPYCWLRAGRAVRALADSGLLPAALERTAPAAAPSCAVCGAQIEAAAALGHRVEDLGLGHDGLGHRVTMALWRKDVRTRADAARLTDAQILAVRFLGRLALARVREHYPAPAQITEGA